MSRFVASRILSSPLDVASDRCVPVTVVCVSLLMDISSEIIHSLLLAILLMGLSGGQFRLVFWLAVIPGLLAVLILLLAVKEPSGILPHRNWPLARRELAKLERRYWLVLLVGWLWQNQGVATTFYAGALIAAMVLGGFLLLGLSGQLSKKIVN